jgi:hypothetical protein
MSKRDGRELARQNELRLLKSLHKYGWLRTRDLAALHWMPAMRRGQLFELATVEVSQTALRMAQRTLARLRRDCKVLWIQAPDGSTIYGLAEAGARQLVSLGIPAKSGKDLVRRISLSHYHHRRLANEVAIVAVLQGYRVASETEIASGNWLPSLLLVHKSMEEAAEIVGATKLRTFWDITVPLVWKGILVGALFSFLTSIQEASATIFLTLGGWEMMPFGIFTFHIAGSQSQAAALGVILIVMCAASLYVVNRIAGTRVGGLFG